MYGNKKKNGKTPILQNSQENHHLYPQSKPVTFNKYFLCNRL